MVWSMIRHAFSFTVFSAWKGGCPHGGHQGLGTSTVSLQRPGTEADTEKQFFQAFFRHVLRASFLLQDTAEKDSRHKVDPGQNCKSQTSSVGVLPTQPSRSQLAGACVWEEAGQQRPVPIKEVLLTCGERCSREGCLSSTLELPVLGQQGWLSCTHK